MLNHLARQLGKGMKAYSAGRAPSGRVNPFAHEASNNAGIDTLGSSSKSREAFTAPAEVCPGFFGGNGQPVKVHWGQGCSPLNPCGKDNK